MASVFGGWTVVDVANFSPTLGTSNGKRKKWCQPNDRSPDTWHETLTVDSGHSRLTTDNYWFSPRIS